MPVTETLTVTNMNASLSDNTPVGVTLIDTYFSSDYGKNIVVTEANMSALFGTSGTAKAVIFESDLTTAYEVLNASNTYVEGLGDFNFLQLGSDVESIPAETNIILANVVSDSSYALNFDITAIKADKKPTCCFAQFASGSEYSSAYINGYNTSGTISYTPQTITTAGNLLFSQSVFGVMDSTDIRETGMLKIYGHSSPYTVIDVSGTTITVDGVIPPTQIASVSGTHYEFTVEPFTGTTQEDNPSHVHTQAAVTGNASPTDPHNHSLGTVDVADIEHTHPMSHTHTMTRTQSFNIKSATIVPNAGDIINIKGINYDVVSATSGLITVEGIYTDLFEDDEIYYYTIPAGLPVELGLTTTRQRVVFEPVINQGPGVFETTIYFSWTEGSDILETKTYYFARFVNVPKIEDLGQNKYRIYVHGMKPGSNHDLLFTDGYIKDYFTEQELTEGGTFEALRRDGWESDQ